MVRSSADLKLRPAQARPILRGLFRLRPWHDERGGSIIEMAFALTILMTLIFGIVQVSLAAYTYHTISELAREGSRFAMVRGSTCSGFTTACPATASDVTTYVEAVNYPALVVGNMTVATTWPNGNSPGNPVKVTVTYGFPLSVPFVPAHTITMSSTSQITIAH